MKRFIIIVSILMSSSLVTAMDLNEIHWVTEEYPPYNYMEDGVRKGIAVDLLKAVWEKAGITKSDEDIQFWPWNRGVNAINTKPGTCLFSTTITDERKNTLGWKFVYPIPQVSDESSNHIIAGKDKGITFKSVDDLKNYKNKYGIVRGDVGGALLLEAGVDKSQLDESPDPNQLIRKLDKGRYDIVSYGYETLVAKMKSEGVDSSNYEIVFTFPPKPMGFAFHKDTDDAVLKKLQMILDELHKDGTAAAILEKYKK